MVVFLFAVLHTYQTVKSVQFEVNSGYCCCDGCVFICSITYISNSVKSVQFELNSGYCCCDGCVFICSITYISNCEICAVWIELRLLLLWWLCFYLQYYIHIKFRCSCLPWDCEHSQLRTESTTHSSHAFTQVRWSHSMGLDNMCIIVNIVSHSVSNQHTEHTFIYTLYWKTHMVHWRR